VSSPKSPYPLSPMLRKLEGCRRIRAEIRAEFERRGDLDLTAVVERQCREFVICRDYICRSLGAEVFVTISFLIGSLGREYSRSPLIRTICLSSAVRRRRR
jgi:hypothetical protein